MNEHWAEPPEFKPGEDMTAIRPFAKLTDFTRHLIADNVPDTDVKVFTAELVIIAPGGQKFGVAAALSPREAAYVNHGISQVLKDARRYAAKCATSNE